MIRKTLFIHAGGAKTGSTLLQEFLYNNASRLESLDFNYNLNAINNGLLLYDTLSSVITSDNEIDSLVLKYFSKCNNAICSSEYFQLTDVLGWKKLIESASRLDLKLKVIFYVRDVFPYLLSNYDQVIKHNGEFRLFDEWSEHAHWQHVELLKIFAYELPHVSLQVKHFNESKKNLIRGFLDILGIDQSFKVDQCYQKSQVNRSLNCLERELLIKVNSTFGKHYSSELTNLFINLNPNAQVEPVICAEKTKGMILSKFSHDVNWVNNTFFSGQSIVSVFLMESQIKQEKNLILKQSQNNSIDHQVLEWALEKLKTIQHETESRLLNAINKAASQNASKSYPPEMPADFDAAAYFVLNPDVFHAGMDAIQHYINHGKAEGRVYSFSPAENLGVCHRHTD